MRVYLKENLRRLRENKSITQMELATIVDVKKNTYSNYETGYSNPDFLVLKRLSNYFGYKVDDLLYTHIPDEDIIAKDRIGTNGHPVMQKKDGVRLQGVEQNNVYDADCNHSNFLHVLTNIEETHKELPGFYQSMLGPGLHLRFCITGDGMHSTIKNNDMVIATHMTGTFISHLREGSIYVLVDKEEGIICKRVYKQDENHLTLTSDNYIYKPYNRHLKYIATMYKIRLVQSSDLKNYNTDKETLMLLKNMNDITSKFSELVIAR